MKLDGMDAVARAVNTPVHTPDQTISNAGAAGGAIKKAADNAEQTGQARQSGQSGGGAAIGAKKARAADMQPYDRQFQPQQDESITEKAVREAIEKANRALVGNNRKFEISIHEKTKDILIRVVDTQTNETIREIPPRKIVDIVASLCEIAGIFFDEKG